ncbi:MAG: peptidoglycan DD-metalloendopeptidase family protein [Gemmatimonadetes bacterium]|nr:peptidoglycan DD-metalloendopeptidase family protein [Gemmatimonadota bacterium]
MLRRACLALGLVVLAPSARAQLADRPVLAEVRVPKPPTLATGRQGDVLTYEVHVTNFERTPLTWTALDVQDAATGLSLARLADSAFQRDISRPGMGAVPMAQRATIGAGLRAILFVTIPVAHGPVPAALRHVLTFTDSAGARTLAAGRVAVNANAALIGPPFRGGPWLAANGPSNGSGHRRALIPLDGQPAIAQRFAIDWVMVDSAGTTHKGDSLDNASYYSHDRDVIAVANGIVRVVKDGIPENVPGLNSRAVPITLETVGGNHVILEVGPGRYAFYAHVRPGSIRVKVGERVRRGQVLAKLGNSGNSTEPHLHFHMADGPAPLAAQGIPYLFDRVEFVGTCSMATQKCAPTPAEVRTRVMPFADELVRFP